MTYYYSAQDGSKRALQLRRRDGRWWVDALAL